MPGRIKLLVAALETSVSCILTGSQVIQGDKLCDTLEGSESTLEKRSWKLSRPRPRWHSKHKGQEQMTHSRAEGSLWQCSPASELQMWVQRWSFPGYIGNSLQDRRSFCPKANTAMSNLSNFQNTSLGAQFLLSSHTTYPSSSIPCRGWIHPPYGAPLLSQTGEGIKYCSVSPKWLNEEHKLQNFLPEETQKSFPSCCSKHFCASTLEQSQFHASSRKNHMDPVDWNWSLMTTFHLQHIISSRQG